jgi:hypothetical protein
MSAVLIAVDTAIIELALKAPFWLDRRRWREA